MLKRLILLAAMGLPLGAVAQDLSIEDVISNQLQAFNDRDVEGAWQYASPMIQGMFRTPENFGNMVRNGYPMVWDNAEARFLEQEEFESRTRQEVLIKGPDGAFYILDYTMVLTPDGWQINGVQVIPAPEVFS